ncbi:autotransporter domain-containing protein [Pseudomonas sp. NPDC007930]|uniref:autotransporter family protein n=1 Tax=Pseudomonas sp. NPDC007930 TaxID=3364417 RepID=UPI0036E04ACE
MNNHNTPLIARTPLALAIALNCGALPSPEALAAACPEVVSSARASGCRVPAGQNLQVTASGAINGGGNAAVLIDHPEAGASTLRNSGSLSSEALGVIWLRHTEVTGDLLNNRAGTVTYTSDAPESVALRLDASTLHGSIANNGTLNGGLRSDHSQLDGSLTNRGVIDAQEWGSYGVRLLYTEVGGDVVNRGEVLGSPFGTAMALSFGSVAGDVINSNLISGNNGMVIGTETLGGSFINSGVIEAKFNPDGGGRALSIGNTQVQGDVKNSGTVEGPSAGLVLTNTQVAGRLYNSGRISAGYGSNGDSSAIGVAVNGTTQLNGGLVNSGLLQGRAYALYVQPTARLDALNIAGNNTAIFDGAVYAPSTTVNLYSNATYTLQDGNRFSVANFINRGVLGVAATSPGGASALATIDGDYHQAAGATLRTQVLDAEHYGQLVVSGTATLPSQAKIDVDVANANQPFTTARLNAVLSAGSLKSDGSFAVSSNSALFDFGAQKVGNQVDLTLSAKPTSSARAAVQGAGLAEAGGAAQVLDAQFAQGSASPLSAYFVSATSQAEVARAVGQALPSGDANLRASQAALGQISDALQARLVPAGLPAIGLAQAPAFWSQPFNSLANRPGASQASSGQVLGFDTRTSPTQRVGMAFAYARGASQGQSLGPAQDSRLDLWQFTGYSAHSLAPGTELLLYAGAGHNRVDNQRALALGGASGAAKASYDSLFATLGASLGHAYQVSQATRLTPSLRLDYNHIRDDGYRESGGSAIAPLLLSVDGRQTDQLIAGLDGRLEHAFSPGGASLRLTLGVGYDLLNQPGEVTARFAGAPGQRFTVRGERADPWLLRGGVGLAAPLSATAKLTVGYSLQQRSDFTDQGGNVGVEWAF